MSTRAVIAMPRTKTDLPPKDAKATGFFGKLLGLKQKPAFDGVYHHNEGYPGGLGELIFDLVNHRYGRDVTRFWKEIIQDNPAGWSNLFPLGAEPLRATWNGKDKMTAAEHFASEDEDGPRLPVTYQGDPQRDLGFKAPPIAEGTDKMGAEYVYVVTPSALVIFTVGENGVSTTEQARIAWTETPDWDAITEKMSE